MIWMNIKLAVLRSPEFIGSDPIARATWLYVNAWCCEQENDGVIKGARKWKDRQWQQTCGVTLAEVEASMPLVSWEGDDLVVAFYPREKQEEIKAKRAGGHKGGKLRGKHDAKDSLEGQPGSPSSTPSSTPSTERKGRESIKEEESKEAAVAIASALAKQIGFLPAWKSFRQFRMKIKKPMTERAERSILKTLAERPAEAVLALEMSERKGWRDVQWEWFDNQRKNTPSVVAAAQPKNYPTLIPEAYEPMDMQAIARRTREEREAREAGEVPA